MVDIVSKQTRSRMMAGIKGKNTKPELQLRHALHGLGLRYRLHLAWLPGRPDIVFPKYQAVVQVHGCFWHRHDGCSLTTTPSSNVSFWHLKFEETTKRDRRNFKALRQLGWRVAVVWECSLRDDGVEQVARKIASWLESENRFLEVPRIGAALSYRLRRR
ncbi:DNA mismatch endonuclease Vsr [Bradyrhizobium tropiciagri]|uniref:very short patch repair endonuclease n=1 Tax=Bradyrhizobium tropiciagri TaxID=312253 RepID=UPI001BA4F884|nr:DNA mismatch endonuclease Vsr [Bradyrhizobium tropiciagri]MBR0899577.1 DNA mismatch endonuclease Vsr [Bradyrhizobium tropiciagri]